ncbi:MAG TPA: APC family permease [Thermoleophilaceae bacterium]|jgi:amino acid transporter
MSTEAQDRPAQTLEQRVVGLPTAIGTTFGLIVASTVMASIAAGFFASYVFLVAVAIGLFAMYLQSMSFSELATMIPKAGSMNEYVRPAFGTFVASLTVLVGYIAVQLFPTAAESFTPSVVLHDFLGADFFSVRLWVVILVAFVAIVNIAGIRPYARVEVALTTFVAASLFVFGVIGVAGLGSGDTIGGAFPHVDFTWDTLWPLLGIAVFTFVGMEYTCPLAEELRNPGRDIPLGIFLGLGLVAVPIVLFGLAGARYVPADQLGQFSPVAHMDVATAVLGNFGKWWIGIVSIGATLSTLNALVAGIPRIFYGMALTRQLPSVFAYLQPATRAPVVGIVVVALMPILMNLFIDLGTSSHFIELILAGVLGWATAYIIIHLSVIVLRTRYPDARRPFRSPLYPLPQLVGGGILVVAALRIFPDPTVRDHIYRDYGIFLGVAVLLSLLYNAYSMRSLTAQFRPVPLDEVYREADRIEAELPLPVEPGPAPGHSG